MTSTYVQHNKLRTRPHASCHVHMWSKQTIAASAITYLPKAIQTRRSSLGTPMAPADTKTPGSNEQTAAKRARGASEAHDESAGVAEGLSRRTAHPLPVPTWNLPSPVSERATAPPRNPSCGRSR